MNQIKLTIEQQIELCKLSLELCDDKAIAAKYGIAVDTVRKLRKRHGFRALPRAPRRHGGGQKKREPVPVPEPFED